MGDEEDEHDSPVEGQPEKVKKPKKVYCYISPKVPEERGEEPGGLVHVVDVSLLPYRPDSDVFRVIRIFDIRPLQSLTTTHLFESG